MLSSPLCLGKAIRQFLENQTGGWKPSVIRNNFLITVLPLPCFIRSSSSAWREQSYHSAGSTTACRERAAQIQRKLYKSGYSGTSLEAQWLRIHLPMLDTRVWSLVREDPTCCGATKPVSHNYWACALEPASHNYWAHVLQLLKPARLEPVLRNKRSHCNEKPAHRSEE